MRNFVLGANAGYPTGGALPTAESGVAFIYTKYDEATKAYSQVSMTTGKEAKRCNLYVHRSDEKGGPIILPVYAKDFTYSKMSYEKSSKFEGKIVLPADAIHGDYTIIVAKKGLNFNERNRWSATVPYTVKDADVNALGAKLAAAINNNSVGSGVEAKYTEADKTLTITAKKDGVGYELITADMLSGVKATISAQGLKGQADAAMIKDMFEKAASDAGFEYTAYARTMGQYPGYFGWDPLAQPSLTDNGFDVFTMRFAEPRESRQVDEVVYQIIQVAFPRPAANTEATASADFEAVLKGLAGIEVETTEEP